MRFKKEVLKNQQKIKSRLMKNYVSMLLCCILPIICLRGFSRDSHYSQFFEALLLPAPSLVGVCPGDLRLQIVHHLQLVHAEFPKYNIHGGAVLSWNDPVNPIAKIEINPLASLVNYDTHISKLSSANNGISSFEMALPYQKNLSRDAVRYPVF